MDLDDEMRAWADDQAARHGHDPDAIVAMLRERGCAEWQIQVAARIDIWADEDVPLVVCLPPEHGHHR